MCQSRDKITVRYEAGLCHAPSSRRNYLVQDTCLMLQVVPYSIQGPQAHDCFLGTSLLVQGRRYFALPRPSSVRL